MTTTKRLSMNRHRHQPVETYRDASGGGYTRDTRACGAIRFTAWSRRAKDAGDGHWDDDNDPRPVGPSRKEAGNG